MARRAKRLRGYASLVACALLGCQWMRSCAWLDMYDWDTTDHDVLLFSWMGRVEVMVTKVPGTLSLRPGRRAYRLVNFGKEADDERLNYTNYDYVSPWGFALLSGVRHDAGYLNRPMWIVAFPYWPLIPLCGAYSGRFLYLAVRAVRRTRRGLCASCGYDLTGNVSGTCPECGTPVVQACAGRRTRVQDVEGAPPRLRDD